MTLSTVEKLSSGPPAPEPHQTTPNGERQPVIIRPVHDQGVVWRNGQLVPFADATCHVLSHMAARGSQVFDVMLVTKAGGAPSAVGLRAHVARFLRSAELMGMEDVGEVGDLERAIAQTVTANASPVSQNAAYRGCFVVKLIAGWTEEAIGVMPADVRPTVYVVVLPTGGEEVFEVLKSPVKVKSATMPKMPAEILPPSMKVAASYTPGLREQLQARAEGFDHTVFKTVAGDLAESTTLSMLVVTDGRILAPPLDSVLDGITRRIVLDVAQDAGIPVEVRAIGWDEVLEADELFLSSTTHPIVPVALLDQQGYGAPGPVTRALAMAMTELYAGGHRLSEQWLTPLRT